MTKYPIIIPTLNRYEKLKNCISSLLLNDESKETELVIGLDFPPSEKYVDGYNKIKNFLPTITGFGKITIFEHKKNLGASENSFFLQKYAFEHYDAYIYSEDDNIFSPFFLKFMNEGLEKYKNDDFVFAVCGYSYPIDWKTDKDCVLQHQYFSAWGYGAWKDKEEKLEKMMNPQTLLKLIKVCDDSEWKKSVNFMRSCSLLCDEKIQKSDVSRSVLLSLNNKNVLMPVKTLVKNTGIDGSGEHCFELDKNIFESQKISEKEIDINLIDYVKSQNLEEYQKNIIPDFKKKSQFSKILYYCCKIFGIRFMQKIKKVIKRR